MSDKLRAYFQLQPTALHCVILSKPPSLVVPHVCLLERGSEDADSAPFPREVPGRRAVMGQKLGENPEERRQVNSGFITRTANRSELQSSEDSPGTLKFTWFSAAG